MSSAHRVLVFDSGLGGISVARAIKTELPAVQLLYAADNAAFPYGEWREPQLVSRICTVVERLVEITGPDALVVACNTASTLALDQLRTRLSIPVIGTVPAIKPAAEATRSGLVGVLATPGTVRREYTQALIHTYAFHCRVFLHGAPRLAAIAETKLKGGALNQDELVREISPVFRKRGGKQTDVVVLGCTHYPLLLPELNEVAPWDVTFIDPAPAIARHLATVLAGVSPSGTGERKFDAGTALVTARRSGHDEYVGMLHNEGFEQTAIFEMPV